MSKLKLSEALRKKDPIEVVVRFEDAPDETHEATLNPPDKLQVLEIRRRLSLLKDMAHKGTIGEDYIGPKLAALCIEATLADEHTEGDRAFTEDDWVVFVLESGGEMSDISIAALKLCGYPAFEKVREMAESEMKAIVDGANLKGKVKETA